VDSFCSTYGKEKEEVLAPVSSEEWHMREELPEGLSNIQVLETTLNDALAKILDEAGFHTVADLSISLKMHPDNILKLQGIGPKAMADIAALVDSYLQTTSAETAAEPDEQSIETETEPAEAIIEQPMEEVETALSEELPEVEETIVPDSETNSDSDNEEIAIDEDISFEEIFTLKPELLDPIQNSAEGDDESDDSLSAADKNKKKKRKNQTIEYDPDVDLVIKRKKHKHSGGDWDWDV
jgi:N utilization substance protein A